MDAKPEWKISRREDGSFVIDATTPVGDVLARLRLKEPQEQRFVTVSGLVLSRLDHGPQPGARVSYDGWDFEILEVDGTRIKTLLALAGKSRISLLECLDHRIDGRACAVRGTELTSGLLV